MTESATSDSNGQEYGATGIVVIGRNEGPRITRCLESLSPPTERMVYVDSGSSDDSIERACALGFSVVELGATGVRTAARARNVGFATLARRLPKLEFVQFVDGDSELDRRWIPRAMEYMVSNPNVAVACGILREREPNANAYHRLASLEWDQPIGEIHHCGGNALYRARVFDDFGGFAEEMLAGEEPELCLRITERGHTIVRLGTEMATHEISMSHFGQWWRRGVRSGHAFAEIVHRRGLRRARLEARRLASALFWGGALLSGLLATPATGGWSLMLWTGPAALWFRIFLRSCSQGLSQRDAALFASDCLGRKLSGLEGLARYLAASPGSRSQTLDTKVG